MNTWEESILRIIAENNGMASLRHIYSELPTRVTLTEKHYKINYKIIAYHKQTRAHVGNLLKIGELSRTDRGVYSITLKGRSRIGAK